MRVHEIMSTEVVTAGPDTSVTRFADLPAHHRIGSVPVLDPSGALAGAVAATTCSPDQGAPVMAAVAAAREVRRPLSAQRGER